MSNQAIKGIPRSLEAAAAAVGLALAAPVLALCALAVAKSGPGGVLFKQRRMGRFGHPFEMRKFRTMRVTHDGPGVTRKGDDRVTPIGKVLRKYKLDELPELVHILTGEMSIVGPRPEVPRYVDLDDPRWAAVLQARPGLTDPVTLWLRNEEQLLEEAGGDTEAFYREVLLPLKLQGYQDYLAERTFRKDIAVILKTLLATALPHRAPAPSLAQIQQKARELKMSEAG